MQKYTETSKNLNRENLSQLTLLSQAPHVNLTVLPGSDEAKKMTVTSGLKLLPLLKQSDQLGLLLKQLMVSQAWNSTKRLLKWKVSVTAQRRLLYRLVPSILRSKEIGCGLWPTPTTRNPEGCPSERKRKTPSLESQAVMYSTPQSRDYRIGQAERWNNPNRSRNLNDQIGGKLNPEFVEWLMGFPKGWVSGGTHKQQLTALGGSIVPEVPYQILKAIAQIEGEI